MSDNPKEDFEGEDFLVEDLPGNDYNEQEEVKEKNSQKDYIIDDDINNEKSSVI